MRRLSQKGHVSFIVLALVVVAAIAGVGFWVWQNQEDKEDQAAYTPAPSQPCEGEWFDTHAHLDNDEFSQDLADQMRTNKVGCSLMFAHVDINDPDGSMLKLREEFAPNPGRFVLFADVIEDDLQAVTREKLENLFSKYPDTFKGIGENAFYRPPQTGTSLNAEPWHTIFDFAAEKNVFVMLHLTEKEKDDFVSMLQMHPNTKVLLHHKELKNQLPQLLKDYPNLYYTLDTTNLLTVAQNDGTDDVLLYPQGEGNAQQFLSKFGAMKGKRLEVVANEWKEVFAAAPERVMWGTDVSMDWHVDGDVYRELVGFSNEFAAGLPEQYRKDYMFQNALDAFGKGITLQPLNEDELTRLDDLED